MNPCPHPVHSAERAARELVIAWAHHETTTTGPPTPEAMAEAYLEVRDHVLAHPPARGPRSPGADTPPRDVTAPPEFDTSGFTGSSR